MGAYGMLTVKVMPPAPKGYWVDAWVLVVGLLLAALVGGLQ